MSFQATCKCVKHDEFCTDSTAFTLKKLSSRPFRQAIINALSDNNLLPKRSAYLCTACAAYTEKHLLDGPTSSKVMKVETTYTFGEFVEKIKCRGFSEDEMCDVARALGESQQDRFRSDAKNATKTYKNEIKSFDMNTSVNSQNRVALAFCQSLTGSDITKPKRSLSILAAIGCLLSASVHLAISPLFFALNLTCYFISGSRTVVSLLSSFTPAGSYGTLINWLQENTAKEIECPKDRDVVTFFDNNQMLVRNWRVRYDSKAVVSVFTNIMHIFPTNESKLQFDASLNPASWLYDSHITSEDIYNKMNLYASDHEKLFSEMRDDFIKQRISKITNEWSADGSTDIIKNCIDSDCEIACHEPTNMDKYNFLPSNECGLSPRVIVGNPCFKNPCSYDSVKEVLKHIANATGLDSDREWNIVGCDGLPYVLGSRLIEENRDLQNILLQPGSGHYEINMVKACFRLLWDPIISDVAQMLGYRSIRALTCCKSASNHHKSWQILEVVFYAVCDELISVYVKECLMSNVRPSLNGYYSWLSKVENANYRFMKDVTFTYLLSLIIHRAGIRRNNHDAILSSRLKFSNLFYGVNMTMYQEILYRDIKTRVLQPNRVEKFVNDHESFSVTGHPSKCEGGDFILEAKNRRTKMFMPPGVPTENRWLRVCKNLDHLQEIRNNVFKAAGINQTDDDYIYHTDLSLEIRNLRMRLRKKLYFENPLDGTVQHVSTTDEELDNELVDFHQHCKGNREIYFENAKNQQPGKGSKLVPIFTTPNDRSKFQSIENKTKDDIKNYILKDIKEIADLGREEEARQLNEKWNKKVKKGTKEEYITFYKAEVTVTLDDALQRCVDQDETET